ncbi:MAG: heterodisulfide reductase subunit B [Desulfobacterales bacterium]|nr:MAG: heterodisulfide reductase subunit B [Desulfobacterales bacterium]
MKEKISIPYYPGCSGTGTSKEYDISTRSVCKALDVELLEIEDWSCCGSTPAHTVNHVLSAALSARNLSLVKKMGYNEVTTPCPSCLTNLKAAEHKMHKEEFRNKVNALLDDPLDENVVTKSSLQVIYEGVGPEEVAARVTRPLKGLKLACYYGCIMNRPPEVMQFDDHEHPMAMDHLMEALGATVLPFPLKVECCGGAFGVPKNRIVTTLSGKLLGAAEALDVDAVVTACPLCQMNLDLRQGQVNRANHTDYNIPVFYFTQLMGYALGLSEKKLGIKKLIVNPFEVLKKLDAVADAA